MHPVLFKIGYFELHTWGVAFVLSVLAGLWISMKRKSRWGVPANEIVNLFYIVLIAAVFGSRFWYVVYHLDEFRGHWFEIINPVHNGYFGIAGMSMVGGVIVSLIAAVAYILYKRLNVFTLGDTVAPAFLLGAGITRLGGCFMAGCCFGKPTDHFLGMVFPPESVAGSFFPNTPIWPTQLFASLLGFLGFVLVLWAEKKIRFQGFTLGAVFIYYCLDRFIVDQFRYYENPQILGTFGPFTFNVNHLLLGALFIFSGVSLIRGWGNMRRNAR